MTTSNGDNTGNGTAAENPGPEMASTGMALALPDAALQAEHAPQVQAMLAEYDEKINNVAALLYELADKADNDELKEKLEALAEQASPVVKGVDESLQTSRAKMPFVNLVQPVSDTTALPDGVRPGHMVTSTGHALGDSLNIIPIYMHKKRVKWVQGNTSPDCLSYDGEIGTRYGACAQCPYATYDENMRSECRPGLSFFVLTEDLQNLYAIDFLKSNAAAGKRVLSLSSGATWGRSFKLTSEKKQQKTTNMGSYYVYNVTPVNTYKPTHSTYQLCELLWEHYFRPSHKKTTLLMHESHRKGLLGHGGPGAGTPGASETNGAAGPESHLDAPDTDAIDFSGSM